MRTSPNKVSSRVGDNHLLLLLIFFAAMLYAIARIVVPDAEAERRVVSCGGSLKDQFSTIGKDGSSGQFHDYHFALLRIRTSRTRGLDRGENETGVDGEPCEYMDFTESVVSMDYVLVRGADLWSTMMKRGPPSWIVGVERSFPYPFSLRSFHSPSREQLLMQTLNTSNRNRSHLQQQAAVTLEIDNAPGQRVEERINGCWEIR